MRNAFRFSRPLPIFFGLAASLAFSSTTLAKQSKAEFEAQWAEFQKNPRAFMDKVPAKKNAQNRPAAQPAPAFSAQDIKSGSFISKKAQLRVGSPSSSFFCDENGTCLNDILEGRAGAKADVNAFLELDEMAAKNQKPVYSITEMEQKGLMSAKLKETPWSDTYWPIYAGILGNRYASPAFVKEEDWKGYHDHITSKQNTLKSVYLRQDPAEIDLLSPSEKYDLLIGDLSGSNDYENGYLTPSMWREGEGYWKQSGKVEGWMGICHGWAPAAFMMERPVKSVTVPAADAKTKLTFYPSDLKGLASYLWSKGNFPTKFMGGRCNVKDPDKDPQTGRILNEECFDTNPANWHQVVVNQIGVAKRSFVVDVTYDYEVWNQPVSGYEYRYFNPQTGAWANSLSEAGVEVSEFTNDKFAKFRSKNAKYVVGIYMTLYYTVETSPSHNATDSADEDYTYSANFIYDLEFDESGKMVGGEWYGNAHPDFLWMPTAKARAEAYGDRKVLYSGIEWTPAQPLPKFWRDIAVMAAVKYGQPLANIVEPLIKETKKPTPQ